MFIILLVYSLPRDCALLAPFPSSMFLFFASCLHTFSKVAWSANLAWPDCDLLACLRPSLSCCRKALEKQGTSSRPYLRFTELWVAKPERHWAEHLLHTLGSPLVCKRGYLRSR